MTTPTTNDFVGLADTIYRKSDLTQGSSFQVNGTRYQVVDVINHSSSDGFYGAVLYDQSSGTLFVVDRGTDPKNWQDIATDIVMAGTDDNLQWNDANALAQLASQDAASLGATSIYTVGHSLGGTLAQMQAAIYGWNGVTFNAYGSGEVLSALGYSVSPDQPNIMNYRTLFDLVSESSTQIGNVVTLETSQDRDFLASSFEFDPLGLVETVGADHGISNFYNTKVSHPTESTPTYVAASMFSFPEPADVTEYLAQNMVMGFGKTLSTTREILADIYNTTSTKAIASDVLGWIEGKYQSGETVVIPADYALVTNALNPSTAYNIYRASLDAGSSVVLDGIDPSEVQSDTLWSPGQTSGLTKEYLVARGAMVQATLKMAAGDLVAGGTITTDDSGTYVYTDLAQSPDPLYTLTGTGPDTYSIKFGTDGNDVLSPTAGTLSEVFGGAGDDTIHDGPGNSTLEGGAGDDHYWIDGTEAGTDHILDTDGQGDMTWELPGGSAPILTGGDAVPGGSMWKSADGSITYTELAQADGTTELEIRGGNKTVFVDDFTNGELGITLNAATPPATGPSNLTSLRDEGLVGNTDIPGGADYVYTNDANTGPVASIYGPDSSGTYGNEINGEGNAGYIYAGNGDNEALLGDFSQKATVPLAILRATIQGGSGDQTLIGMGNGNETISGGAVGSDTSGFTDIDGGGADALLVGGGQNSVIFGGTGADTLVASSAGTSPPAGFDPSTLAIAGVSFWGDAYSQQLDENGNPYEQTSLPKTTMVGGASPEDLQVDLSLYQSDGTYGAAFGLLGSSLDSGEDQGQAALPGSELIGGTGFDWLVGNSGNDTIIGGDPTSIADGVTNEVLVGGAGADLIYGGSGNEIIFGDMPPGAVSGWANLDVSHADTIYGGNGTDYIYGSGGDDVIYGGSGTSVIDVGNGDSYVDAGSGLATIYGGSGDDTIVADGVGATIQTGDGNATVEVQGGQSTITTGAGADTIDASGGDAFITEGSGTTTIIAGIGTGSDTVQQGAGTTVQLQDGLTESTLMARDVNGDLVLSDEESDTQITFNEYFNGGGNVSIQFHDGTTWGAPQILLASMAPRTDGGNDTLVGSDGNDSITAGYGDTSIVGVSGNNTLAGGAGDDTIQGGSGADTIEGGSGTTQIVGGTGLGTYVYNLGDGSDTIFENDTTAGADTLQFGAGIDPSDLTYSYDSASNNLLIGFGILSDAMITILGLVAAQPTTQHQITTFSFADGTTLTQLQVIQRAVAIYGTTGNETLTGTTEMNYFDGKGGNDVEIGEGGNDTFVFNSGYGDLTINESYTSGQLPVLQLGAGIAAPVLHVTTNRASLKLTDGVSGDQITLDNMWSTSGDGVATVQFADGTTLTAAQLLQMELTGGTSGNDTIYGTAGADLIDGKGGNDSVNGDGGNDTFVFDSGYGYLVINNTYASGQQPVLQLGAGIAASALHVTTDGNNLFLTDGVSGDQVIVDNMWSTGGDGVAAVQLTDGTMLTASQLIQMEMAGTTGNDTLWGTKGADLIDGNGGNDSVNGDGGNDTFVFNSGYGHLEINENYTSSQQPVLQLGTEITVSALHVTTDGTNLKLTDGVSGDQIFLDGMWSTGSNGVAAVRFADGTTLTRDQLIQMEMTGTTGSDSIYGTSGDDLIDSKGGGDSATGDGGNDTFVFNAGYGELTIYEDNSGGQHEPPGTFASGKSPILELGPGITLSDLDVGHDSDIYITDGISGDEIILKYAGEAGDYGVAEVQLADGTTLTAAQLLQMRYTINGTPGNDTLYGGDGDLVDGKGGDDTVYGFQQYYGYDDDTVVFNPGYGQLEINQFGTSYVDTNNPTSADHPLVQLGAGLTASMLHMTVTRGLNQPPNTYGGYPAPDNIVITDGISGDKITLDNMWDNQDSALECVQLADGTSLTVGQLEQMEINGGTTGNDAIYGTLSADLIDGKGGNDSVYGSGFSGQDGTTYSNYGVDPADDGNDTFVFNAGYGHLGIMEQYDTSQPILQLGMGIMVSALHVTSDGASLILSDGISGDQIKLWYMFAGATGWGSTWGVAAMQFADGTSLTASQLIQMEMTGTIGDDTIYGTLGADSIDGKGGNDSVVGQGGNDTLVFNAGYGHLEINEYFGTGPQPVLTFGDGIAASALQVTVDGDNLVLTDGVSGDQVTLDNMSTNEYSGIGEVQLADGTTLTAAQLIAMSSSSDLIDGTTGNDTLTGTSGADLIDGKGGSDSVIGNGGSDTFVFNSGYGDLAINESYTSGQEPVLQLGAGITASTLLVRASGKNLVLTDGVSGDQITLDNEESTSGDGVAVVQFFDGTTLSAAQLVQMSHTITGTTGNDTLTGTTGADLMDGKGGTDSLVGGGGSDTFVFDSGYGHLTVNESYKSGQQPVLQLGDGITASTLIVRKSGNNLVLTDGVSGDKVTLVSMWSSSTHGVATTQLADGTTFTRSQLIQMEMTGTTGNDTLHGTSGANLIDGEGGSDSVVGGGGNDTFVFDSGYGHLTINETYTTSQQPLVQFGAGITSAALNVTTSGSNLVLKDGVTGDQITLISMATSSTRGVGLVKFADGTTLTRSQLLQMEQTSATRLLARSPATVDLTPAMAPMSSRIPDLTPDLAPTGSRIPNLTPDLAPTGSRIPNLTPDNPVSPSQGVVIGAGNVRLQATTTSTISSTNGRLGGGPQNHGVSHTHARAGQPLIADAHSTTQSMAKEGRQPTSAGNDADPGTRAPSLISALDTRLASSSLLTQAQPESDMTPTPGAPADTLLNDLDDPGAGADLSHGAGVGNGWQRPSGTASDSAFAPAYGQRQLVNTASAADAMVRALAPRNGLRSMPIGSESASETQDEIRFQGNDVWSRSAVDRTLAALPSTGGAVSDLSSRLTDLAHAQLISAMASFRPSASAESTSTIPPNLDTYTLAAAAGMH